MNESVPQHAPEEACFPSSWQVKDLARHLRALRAQRNEAQNRAEKVPRASLRSEERDLILRKTAGRCHICGGLIDAGSYWEADHVLRRAVGGGNEADNYLAAHGLCNTYRWDHLPEEMQWVLKIGVWARKQMEGNSDLGLKMLASSFKNEKRRERRKKLYRQAPASGDVAETSVPARPSSN